MSKRSILGALAAAVFAIGCGSGQTNNGFDQARSAEAGKSGATLQASKTLDICDNGNGTYKYSGEVSVWNTGENDAEGLEIADCLQYKAAAQSGQPTNVACLADVQGSVTVVPGLTSETNALTFPYEFTSYTTPLDLTGTIRNSAVVTIKNHSGGIVNGPNPKYTWTGSTVPLCTPTTTCGCTYSQGYWDNKPGVAWPSSGPHRTDTFFNSGLSYQQILDASAAGGNAYINLAHQYIAAVLNVANGACEPSSVATYIGLAHDFFAGFAAGSSYCSSSSSGCPLQVTWAGILDDYNQGTGSYASNPGHCGDE